MEITKNARNQLRLQNIIFIVLFLTAIILLAWLSNKYNIESDWTKNNKNTLSDISIKALQQIPHPIEISAYLPGNVLRLSRSEIRNHFSKYQKYKKDIKLKFVNLDTSPDKVREMKITNMTGEIIITYQGRSEHIFNLKEQTIANTLLRLLRQGDRRLLFVTGHGERKPNGQANFDWSNFSEKLKIKGITTELLKLNETPNIPDVTAIVIASPQADFLAGEVKLIINYVKRGGNLIWLQEPGESLYGLQPLADLFGIGFHPGTIVDPTAQMMNVNDPSFALVTSYPSHAISRNFQYMSIFPKAVGIIHDNTNDNWTPAPFLQTVARSWSETGKLKGAVDYNADKDFVGPLTIGLALTVKDKNKKQRIIILGDGDFLSNTYIGNQGNLNIGHNIINWISNDDNFIAIPSSSSVDSQLNISDLMGAIVGLLFLIILPLSLLISGGVIWYKRRSA